MELSVDNPDSGILLCSDLDRTLVPNGDQEESPLARPLLRALANLPELTLAYVTGRDKTLIEGAWTDDNLPFPDFAIGDVGTTIYQLQGEPAAPIFSEWEDWGVEISRDWWGYTHGDLADMLTDLPQLRMQEPAKQNTHKLSFYADLKTDAESLVDAVRNRLEKRNVRAMVIWSVDEQEGVGLLDILPERASKVQAVRFLMSRTGIPESRTVCSGDSGNDLDMLTSGLQAILVKNAPEGVRKEALEALSRKGLRDKLFLPKGDFYGMNGNYSAGVLEGLAHFFPEAEGWIRSAIKDI